jgi:hypothetical protein
MEFIVRVEARLAGRVVKVCDVVTIARPGVVRGEEELGLSLEDGKEIVRELQSRVIAAAAKPGTNGRCGTCGGRTPLPNLGIYSRSSEATCRTEGQHNY